MAALPQQEQDFFWQNGYLVVPDVVSQGALEQLHQTFQTWVEESRSYSENWGETLNGNRAMTSSQVTVRIHLACGGSTHRSKSQKRISTSWQTAL